MVAVKTVNCDSLSSLLTVSHPEKIRGDMLGSCNFLSLQMKPYRVTIQIKPFWQYFCMLPFGF